jgi:stage II sporulation protein AB (anti-sigma F factor)
VKNEMHLNFKALSVNESFARITVAAFISQLDPTMNELTDIKTVVSEAVTNCIIHGYENDSNGDVFITVSYIDNVVDISIRDLGKGIEDIEKAKEPLYTSKPELERSGMGFTIMENFMDEIEIISQPGEGTEIRLRKALQKSAMLCN